MQTYCCNLICLSCFLKFMLLYSKKINTFIDKWVYSAIALNALRESCFCDIK